MDKPSLSRKKEWELTEEAFHGLLGHLSSDQSQAAEIYEGIRRKLITFFEFRGCLTPEDRADETINRVARRIQDGQSISTEVGGYFYGVARNVLREYWKDANRETKFIQTQVHDKPIEGPHLESARESALEQERRLQCLERCLDSLPAGGRRIILLYYRDEKGAQIKTRRLLAEELGIADYALRLRVSRLRAKLDECVNKCLNE